jgi:hypothetical protein
MSESSGHMISMGTVTIRLTWANNKAANDQKHMMEEHRQRCYTQNMKDKNEHTKRSDYI